MLFTTPYLSPSEHSLTVTYLGNGTNDGLMLNYMYLTNVTILSSSGSVTYNDPPTSTASFAPSSSSTPGSSLRLELVLGVVLGVIFLSVLVLFFLYRRRKKHQESPKQTQTLATTGEVLPFLLGAHIVSASPQPALPAPFSKPRRITSASSYPNSNQLLRSSPNFGRYQVKNAAVTDPPDPGAGVSSLENNSTHGGWAAPGQNQNGGSLDALVQRHEDSGLRVMPDVLRLDIPPDYTAS